MKTHFIDAGSVEPQDGLALRFLHELTGGKEGGVGSFNSDLPDIPTGKVYGIKCPDAAEAAAILNEPIPDGRQPFFSDEGFVFINAEDFAFYERDLEPRKSDLRREIDALDPASPRTPSLRVIK